MVRSRQVGNREVKVIGLFSLGFLILALLPLARITAQETVPKPRSADLHGSYAKDPAPYESLSTALLGSDRSKVLSPTGTALTGVKAVVLRSIEGCFGTNLAWDTLNSNWSDFGSVPLEVVYDDPELCTGTITYEDLVASEADVVVISRILAGYTPEETDAIKAYVEEGHNVFATSSALNALNFTLLPVFGLRDDAYDSTIVTPTIDYIAENENDPIFEGLSFGFSSLGDSTTFGPGIGPGGTPEWNSTALNGARFMARSPQRDAAITFYMGKGYNAIYVSNAVQIDLNYGQDTEDLQFLYNALTYPVVRKAVIVRSQGCAGLIGSLELNENWPDFGSTPIFIEFGHDVLCSTDTNGVTYDELVASGADVVIVAYGALDPTFSNDELADLEQYALEGHNLIATGFSLRDPFDNVDNGAIAGLFGLNDTLEYGYSVVTPVVTQVISSPLFTDLHSAFSTSSSPLSQSPPDGTWDENELDGAIYAAKSADNKTIISLFSPENYSAIYISSFPESDTQTTSSQLLYNAISYGADTSVYLYLPAIIKSG